MQGTRIVPFIRLVESKGSSVRSWAGWLILVVFAWNCSRWSNPVSQLFEEGSNGANGGAWDRDCLIFVVNPTGSIRPRQACSVHSQVGPAG